MIPILYAADEQRFVTNGIGRLSDCTRCIVTEERNGIYECEFDYPIAGIHFEDIQLGRLVAVTHDDRRDIQPFEIYKRSVPDLNGIVTFYAQHISYKLNRVVVMPFSASSCAEALQRLEQGSVNANPFTYWTDKTTTASFKSTEPRMARAMLGGEENSILDVFGTGEYEFDRFSVKLYQHRGEDTDVEIRYSKNLVNLSEDVDTSGMYNAIVPFWADTDGQIVTLPEKMLVYSGAEPQVSYLTDHNLIIIRTESEEPIEVAYTEINAAPYDMSEYFEEKPTVSQLRNAARSRFESSGAWLPTENLTVDFIQLWQTEEFKDYAALQRVRLCDTVSVYYPQVGIAKVKQKVIRVVYNVLLDRYDEIELGSLSPSLGQAIKEDVLRDVPTTSMMDAAIRYASDLIRGGLGGYVVMTPGDDGYPQEILIMDSPNVDDAVNVWRFNQGGLGHSSNGYNGPFSDIALTQDGRINATMITTGTLNANLIRAGTIADETGRNYWDLTNGQFVTKQGSIAGLDIGADSISKITNSSYLHIDGGAIEFGSKPGGIVNSKTRLYGGGIRFMSNGTSWDDAVDAGSMWADSNALFLSYTYYDGYQQFQIREDKILLGTPSVQVNGNFTVRGTKSRSVCTDNYSDRLLYAYETPTPMFGDIGEAVIGSDGLAYVDIDDIFSETIAEKVEYQVFLQKEGEGDCWVSEKSPRYFVIQGTPNLKVAWELKAKQKEYELTRLEQSENGLDEYEHISDTDSLLDSYINEQEDLLYGYN